MAWIDIRQSIELMAIQIRNFKDEVDAMDTEVEPLTRLQAARIHEVCSRASDVLMGVANDISERQEPTDEQRATKLRDRIADQWDAETDTVKDGDGYVYRWRWRSVSLGKFVRKTANLVQTPRGKVVSGMTWEVGDV